MIWVHIALYLSTFKSKTYALQSKQTAAKTVLEYEAHFTSPTELAVPKTNNGSLKSKKYYKNQVFANIKIDQKNPD